MTIIDGYAPAPWHTPAEYSGWPSLHPFPRVRQWLCQQGLTSAALQSAESWPRNGATERGRPDARRSARQA